MLDTIPVTRTRAVRLLDDRCFGLKRFIHEQLTGVWENLVHWDRGDKKSLTINTAIEGEHTSLEEAVTSWRSFQELEGITNQLWHDLDDFVIKPRTDIQNRRLLSISILKVKHLSRYYSNLN